MVKNLHQLNTSGLYTHADLHKCSTIGATMRRDLKYYHSNKLIIKSGTWIKINRLKGQVKRLFQLFSNYEKKINCNDNPAVFFADLYKRKVLWAAITRQAFKEAEKIQDDTVARKFLKHVKGRTTPIGVKTGIFISIKTIGRLFGRTKTTGYNYVERMNRTGIIRRKKNYRAVCTIEQLATARKAENLYGRVFINNGFAYERLQNDYLFN